MERLKLRQAHLPAAMEPAPAPVPSIPPASDAAPALPGGQRIKVAILSFLFNWPSTGGGNITPPGWPSSLAGPGTRSGTSSPGIRNGASAGSRMSC